MLEKIRTINYNTLNVCGKISIKATFYQSQLERFKSSNEKYIITLKKQCARVFVVPKKILVDSSTRIYVIFIYAIWPG